MTEGEERPWGRYRVLDVDNAYKVKRLEVLPGCRLSHQRHRQRSGHWVVVRGEAEGTLDGVITRLNAGGSIDIPTGAAHRLANGAEELLVIIETQRGTYFGEDDIERLEDDLGRTG